MYTEVIMIPVTIELNNETYNGVVSITTKNNICDIRLKCIELNLENLRLTYNGDCVTDTEDTMIVDCWPGFEGAFYDIILEAWDTDGVLFGEMVDF